MTVVNALAGEMSMPTVAYLDMCRALNDPHWASVIENMTDAGQRIWVASFMPSSDAWYKPYRFVKIWLCQL